MALITGNRRPHPDFLPPISDVTLDPAKYQPDTELVVGVREKGEDGEWREEWYERSGGCTRGCGVCCLFLYLPLDPRLLFTREDIFDDYIKWLGYHGIDVIIEDDEQVTKTAMARIPIPCSKLNRVTMECSVFGTPDRPDMCGPYPARPVETEDVAYVCTYKWKKQDSKPA